MAARDLGWMAALDAAGMAREYAELLLSRMPDEADRRRTLVWLTDAGRERLVLDQDVLSRAALVARGGGEGYTGLHGEDAGMEKPSARGRRRQSRRLSGARSGSGRESQFTRQRRTRA